MMQRVSSPESRNTGVVFQGCCVTAWWSALTDYPTAGVVLQTCCDYVHRCLRYQAAKYLTDCCVPISATSPFGHPSQTDPRFRRNICDTRGFLCRWSDSLQLLRDPGVLGRTWKRISLPDIRGMSAFRIKSHRFTEPRYSLQIGIYLSPTVDWSPVCLTLHEACMEFGCSIDDAVIGLLC